MKTMALILIGAGLWPSPGWSIDISAPPIVIKVSTTLVTRSAAPRPEAPASSAPSLMQTAAFQAALDRNGFGVGLIDGQAGTRTTLALRDYARSRNITESAARAELLTDDENGTPANPSPRPSPSRGEGAGAMVSYTLTNEDLAQVGTAPTDWEEAEKVPSMACESLDEVLSERFHVSRRFLQRLNPALTNWSNVTAGTMVNVPHARSTAWSASASRLEVDCTAYRIRAFGSNDDLLASFPCSIARKLHKVPAGDLTLVAFAPNPNYTFDPENFPESARAQEIGRKLIIPPGPRNPVGVYWLSLSAPGFGMHGTPHPETIGRRESHGCFRLTNWDITTLASMVEAGTPVRVMNVPPETPHPSPLPQGARE